MRKLMAIPILAVLTILLLPVVVNATPTTYHVVVDFYEGYYTYHDRVLIAKWEPDPVFEYFASREFENWTTVNLWNYRRMYVAWNTLEVNYTIYVWNASDYPGMLELWKYYGKGGEPGVVIEGTGTHVEFDLPDNGEGYVIVIVDNNEWNLTYSTFPACCLTNEEWSLPSYMWVWIQYYNGKLYSVVNAGYENGVVHILATERRTISQHTLEVTDDWCYWTRFGDLYLRDI